MSTYSWQAEQSYFGGHERARAADIVEVYDCMTVMDLGGNAVAEISHASIPLSLRADQSQ